MIVDDIFLLFQKIYQKIISIKIPKHNIKIIYFILLSSTVIATIAQAFSHQE
jgi:hypothetical protein